MSLFDYLRQKINPQNPLLLAYHKFMAYLVSAAYGFPAKDMRVIAVTGTSGKSTTVSMIASIFGEISPNLGVLSSVLVKIKDKILDNDTKITSFSRVDLNRVLRSMKKAGCDTLVLEVTSHALVQSRLAGIPIDAAVLTNLAGDHLEYHGGFENYLEAKMKLFTHLMNTRKHKSLRKIAVLPKDEPYARAFESLAKEQKISFGLGQGAAISASEISYEPDRTRFTLHYGDTRISIRLKLPGKINLLNALAAASVAYGFGISVDIVQKGLEKIGGMPGRYESVRCDPNQNFLTIVDYAHTPKALQELCSFYRPFAKGKLIIVFGATGGGRDKSKRPLMGEVVSKYCDIVIVTDDDPYEEDRWSIIEQVASVVKNKQEGESFFKILGRREAIKKALSLCEKNDILLITGKGCERIWIVGKEKIPWDDREVVKQLYLEIVHR